MRRVCRSGHFSVDGTMVSKVCGGCVAVCVGVIDWKIIFLIYMYLKKLIMIRVEKKKFNLI